jgi:hypothetical protein
MRSIMKDYVIIAVLGAFVLSMETGCVAQDKKVNAANLGVVSSEEKPIAVKKRTPPTEPLVTVKATVKDVVLAKRLLTLKDFAGKVFDLKVGEEVESLAQLKIGDEVVARYYEWAAVEIDRAGGAKGGTTTAKTATADRGDEPAGVVRDRVTVTAKVEEIDHPRTHVTIGQPDGRSIKVFVRRPNYLKDVTVGDLVSITYIEALAVSVEKTKQK